MALLCEVIEKETIVYKMRRFCRKSNKNAKCKEKEK